MTDHTCSSCGTRVDDNRSGGLCPVCLLKEGLTEATAARVDETRQCTKCRNPLGDEARFCPYCGTPDAPVAIEGDPVRAALEAKLQGEYRIVRLLGRGGMGAVYLAKDLILEREVAIKVVSTASDSQEIYDRFRREAKTAARLSHPNIVPLHTFGEVEGMPYFVMGYVRGESLGSRLSRDGTMTEEEGLRVIAEIADALDHAHRQGVVHRDIKPDNVLIDDESGRALLTDFGVARALGRGETITRSGMVVGTPQYMSPEQAEGQVDIDGRSDIYSLGVMAYAILGGRLPFEGTTAADILRKHLTQEPPSLRSFNPRLSDSAVRTIERCLAKERSKRWQDAKSLRLALGVSEEEHLPDSLQAIEGRGLPLLAIVLSFFLFYDLINILSHPHSTMIDRIIPIATMTIVISLLYLFFLYRMRSEGFSPAQSQATLWREPSWWLWWYPKPWRRLGNVWDRLPVSVRVVRSILPAIFVVPVGVGWGWIMLLSDRFRTDRPMEIAVVATIAAIVTVWIFMSRRARREIQRKGIEGEDINRILHSAPPGRVSFWKRPHIAEILSPAIETDGMTSADSPHRNFQSILRYADELSGALRPLGAEAAAAARQLLASIEDADREIAELSRILEAGEEERLKAKI
ncbi:MAG: protein kinase, partial [Acidobacteria bacterium]|nr:protein kinase [Acidobacteriota bacterium]